MKAQWTTLRRSKPQQHSAAKVFGVSLNRSQIEVPSIMLKCIRYLDAKGLDKEGLFRLSGSHTVIGELKARFDRGEDVDLTPIKDHNCVAGLLKLYLREMPEPICTFELYDCFVAAAGVPDENRVSTLSTVLDMLPTSHKVVLKYLVGFLHRVSLHSDVNKMMPANIAIVFAPNIIKADRDAMTRMMEDTPMTNKLVELMIQHFDTMMSRLPDPPEIVPMPAWEGSGASSSMPVDSRADITKRAGVVTHQASDGAKVLASSTVENSRKMWKSIRASASRRQRPDKTPQGPSVTVVNVNHKTHVTKDDIATSSSIPSAPMESLISGSSGGGIPKSTSEPLGARNADRTFVERASRPTEVGGDHNRVVKPRPTAVAGAPPLACKPNPRKLPSSNGSSPQVSRRKRTSKSMYTPASALPQCDEDESSGGSARSVPRRAAEAPARSAHTPRGALPPPPGQRKLGKPPPPPSTRGRPKPPQQRTSKSSRPARRGRPGWKPGPDSVLSRAVAPPSSSVDPHNQARTDARGAAKTPPPNVDRPLTPGRSIQERMARFSES